MFENRVLRMFGPKREKVTGGWKKLYDEKFHNSYSSANITKMFRWRRVRCAGYVARRGKIRVYTYKSLNGERSLGKSSHR
jgi:hypothetical protein